jgi:hypothetical protein
MQRVQMLMGREAADTLPKPKAIKTGTNPLQRLREDAVSRWNERLELLQVHDNGTNKTVVAVVDKPDPSLQAALRQSVQDNLPGEQLEILDRTTYDTIQRLISAGVLSVNREAQTLHQSAEVNVNLQQARKKEHDQRLRKARTRFAQAERKYAMAQVLAKGGFTVEAVPALGEAVEGALESLARLYDHEAEHNHARDDAHNKSSLSISYIESHLLNGSAAADNVAALVAQLREASGEFDEQQAQNLLDVGSALIQHVSETLNKAALQ